MAANRPRAVFVTRETDYELLIAHHATRGQARFFLETRGQRLEDVEARHDRFHAVLGTARASVPADWRQTLVSRADLNRFLFAPDDVIVAVGQDGLVANVAKYLNGQPVLGVNPAPDLYDGVLVRIGTGRLARLLVASAAGDVDMESRTMVQAELGEGETLLALNEIFVGHRSHQSARYRIEAEGEAEDHSSSGLIVASGTGATGWARYDHGSDASGAVARPRGTCGRLLGARALPKHRHRHEIAGGKDHRETALHHLAHERGRRDLRRRHRAGFHRLRLGPAGAAVASVKGVAAGR